MGRFRVVGLSGASLALQSRPMQAPRGRKLLVFWLVLGALCPLMLAPARAEKKTIVMLEVEGEREPKLRKSLELMVKGGHEILPGATYRDAARRLRAQKLTPNNVKEVCRYLRVDGVLDGTLVQDDEGYRLVVRLRSATDGIIEKKIPLRLKQPFLSDKMQNQLAQRLMLAIDNLPSVDKDGRDGTLVAAARDADDEDGKGKKGRKGRDEDEDEPVASKSSRRKGGKKLGPDEVEPDSVGADRLASAREEEAEEEKGGLDEAQDEEIQDERPDGERTASREGSPRATPLLVNLGVSFIGRKLTFDYTGTDTTQAPPGYDGTPVPGAYMTAETYPARFGDETGALANIGVGVVIDRVIGLNSTLDDGTGTLVKIPTRMWRYGANLRYRHNFGDEPNGFSMHGAVGYNTAGFAITKRDVPGTNVDVPNVNYKYIDIGVGGRVPVVGPLSLLAEAKFLGLLNAGQIQTLAQYGPADVSGFEGEAVFEYQITDNVNARAGGRFMQVKMTYDGFGALGDRNSDGMQDVTGSSDRYLGGFVTAGYSF
jgi:hypothetical protein